MAQTATAFAPGHVTVFFAPVPDDDPAVAGSRGAGVALSEGVTVTVEPADERTVRLNGERTSLGAVEGVLESLSVTAAVDAETPLPLGAGFGVSGAAALATALAAASAFDLARTENRLVRTAHVADVEAGTGLGDVVGQFRGGLPVRLEPGAPDHGRLDGLPERPRVEYVAFGDLSTAEVLGGDLGPVQRAGEAALTRLCETPTAEELFAAGRTFARESDLLASDVAAAVDAAVDAGGTATMAMLGRTVVGLGTALSEAGYDARACRVHPTGATVVDDG
jgi:pantoate kinase